MKRWKFCEHNGRWVNEADIAYQLGNKSLRKNKSLPNRFEIFLMHGYCVWWNTLVRKTHLNQDCNTIQLSGVYYVENSIWWQRKKLFNNRYPEFEQAIST